ncbi:Auxilin-related protein 2 [Striga hermonthica]|uniref:Auxilin-related protein 2 n=1 Tax=Striga hermonthica TaxID=68872 RepID=A0A9N7NTJ7_STRHE|nr:Auxilin-related protein 2 [Striga hermonthica]
MDDLDVLARDFGLGARGKSNPMRSAPSDRRPIDDPLFGDVFGGQPKHAASSNPSSKKNNHSSVNDFDYDSIFKSSAASELKNGNNSSSKSSSLPVYDKPVYDEDIFDGLPGLKSKSAATAVRFEDDMFSTISSPPTGKSRNQSSDFDDLLGNLGRNEKGGESNMGSSAKSSSGTKGFDDLLPGFGSASPAASNRPVPESRWGSVPAAGSKHGNMLDDPFVVLGSDSTPHSSSGVFTDPLEDIAKLSKSRSARAEVSSGTGGAFDDVDPLGTSGKSAHVLSPGRDHIGKGGSPSRSEMPQSSTGREPMRTSSFRYSESSTAKKDPVDNFQESPLFDIHNVSTDSQKSFGQTASPQYYGTGPQVDMSQVSEQGHQNDDVWLTVSEIPLFTQPTAAPPPSRHPPPIPRKSSKSETGSYFSSSRKKGDEFSSPSYNSQHFESSKPEWSADKSPPASQFDELDDFATGRSQNSTDENVNLHSSTNPFSAAAASAAAMKDAMDKAEAKFRHAKEVREREHAKAARYKDSRPLEKDETDSQEREYKETQERLERERQQGEEEIEMKRLERERLREIERVKARQAVERANREARERAAADARLKVERAAVEKANAEARARAGRVAVQRAQAEARERAAAEARERAEKAAAEARETAAAEAREKETRDRAAVARAEAEARRQAERAAVERAAAEARGRAAAEARERAAAAAASKMNEQKNDNDLESFFSMGRASSAPRDRTNSTDPFSDQFQNKGGSEDAKRTPPSSGATSNMKKASSSTNFVDDLSSIFGTASSAGEFQEVEGETEERRRARLDRHQRTQERAAKALAEKNQRDLQAQREQEERHRIAETLDIEIKRWAAGKEGNLRALLSTLQYVLWPECGWQAVSLTDLITGASVKKVYRKATLCIHPDKVQQKGATLQQKYIAEKVFDLLKEAWNKFNSEELF